jgi:N-acyl amino acid synthase of PEP-CTERM/exosortase system
MSIGFRAAIIDDSPQLLEESYQLRYQVYCLERKFLAASAYPNRLEVDEFDRDSVHVGVIDGNGNLAGTARIVRGGNPGLPLFRHCTLFPHVTTFDQPENHVVEVSRVSISRYYARRRGDPPFDAAVGAINDVGVAAARLRQRVQHRAQPFITLVKAIITGCKSMGATHFIGATDAALHRWLVHYGLPYRIAGSEVDYYGRVAPYILSLAELDQVVLSRRFAVLDDFPVGMDPAQWPTAGQPDEEIACCPAAESPAAERTMASR